MDIQEAARRAGSHSLFAPSYATTWMACPGALLASAGAPDTAGLDAAWGTVAHNVVEQWLSDGVKPSGLIGTTVIVKDHSVEITEEMMTAAGDCMASIEGYKGKRYVETRVEFSDLTPVPNQGGTCDLAICQSDGTLVIRDWKFGKGVRVDCRDNPQIRLYAYGFFREYDWLYDFQHIDIGICQPRLDHYDSIILTRAELLAFAEEVRAAATLAASPDAPRIPGEKQCRFCKVRTTCPALAVALDDVVAGSFDDVGDIPGEALKSVSNLINQGRLLAREPNPPATLTTAGLARVLTYRKMMESWFSAVADEILTRSQAGEVVPGWRLVQGREGNRQWVNPTDAAARLGAATSVQVSELYHSTLMSPAEAATLLRSRGIKGKQADAFLTPLVNRAPGRPTLVPETDERSSLPNPVDAFEDHGDSI